MLSLDKQDVLKISLPVTNQFKSVFISPMILIPFIENAFKHGLNSQERNSIEIFLGIEEKILNLNVKNSFSHLKEHSNKETPGIGLENVKRRLLLVYPGRHSLAITSDNAFFYVDLKIEL
jgi:LytS/YehU family sensor histidine kinase